MCNYTLHITSSEKSHKSGHCSSTHATPSRKAYAKSLWLLRLCISRSCRWLHVCKLHQLFIGRQGSIPKCGQFCLRCGQLLVYVLHVCPELRQCGSCSFMSRL